MEVGWEQVELLRLSQGLSRKIFREVFIGLVKSRSVEQTHYNSKFLISGQPKRHLLTTGWSVFVSSKRLFAGDSILFIRYLKMIEQMKLTIYIILLVSKL